MGRPEAGTYDGHARTGRDRIVGRSPVAAALKVVAEPEAQVEEAAQAAGAELEAEPGPLRPTGLPA